MSSYNVCSRVRCKNPVPVQHELRQCAKHGGETLPVWAVYHDERGWLTDGNEYSFDVGDAEWFFGSTDDVIAKLTERDLVPKITMTSKAECWRRIAPFVIVLIK